MTIQVQLINQDILLGGTGPDIKYHRGEILTIKDEPLLDPWGGSEVLPMYAYLRVTDTTRIEAEAWVQPWVKSFSYTIVNQNASGWRIRVEVDASLVSASEDNKELRLGMKDYIENGYQFSVFSFKANQVVVDIPKTAPDDHIVTPEGRDLTGDGYPGVNGFMNLQELKLDWNDKWQDRFKRRLYYFPTGVMDTIVATMQGGADYHEATKAEALTYIRSRLDD